MPVSSLKDKFIELKTRKSSCVTTRGVLPRCILSMVCRVRRGEATLVLVLSKGREYHCSGPMWRRRGTLVLVRRVPPPLLPSPLGILSQRLWYPTQSPHPPPGIDLGPETGIPLPSEGTWDQRLGYPYP